MTNASHRVDRLWPEPAADLDLDDAMADFRLPDPPAGRPLLAVNMITSIDGRAQLDGTAEGLGSRADRRLMRHYRAAFDAVVLLTSAKVQIAYDRERLAAADEYHAIE